MKKNLGIVDRIIRALIAIMIAVLYFTGQITGTAAIVLGIVTAGMLITSIAGVCPVYTIFGISTNRKGRKKG